MAAELKPGQFNYCVNCHARVILRDGKVNSVSCDPKLIDGRKYVKPVHCRLPASSFTNSINTDPGGSEFKMMADLLKNLKR